MKKRFRSIMVAVGFASALAATFLAGDVFAQDTNSGFLPAVAPESAGKPDIHAPYAQAIALVQLGALTSAKGFTKFSHPAVGIYCLELASYVNPTTEPVVSIEWGYSLGVVLFAQYNRANTSCPAPTVRTIEVRTYKGDTGAVGSGYQIPVLSNQVAFVILVP
jgi:hypothetical protein